MIFLHKPFCDWFYITMTVHIISSHLFFSESINRAVGIFQMIYKYDTEVLWNSLQILNNKHKYRKAYLLPISLDCRNDDSTYSYSIKISTTRSLTIRIDYINRYVPKFIRKNNECRTVYWPYAKPNAYVNYFDPSIMSCKLVLLMYWSSLVAIAKYLQYLHSLCYRFIFVSFPWKGRRYTMMLAL